MAENNTHINFKSIQRNNLYIKEIDSYSTRLNTGETKRSFEKNEVKKAIEQLGFNAELGYKASGQPYLVNHPDLFISISHSKGWIAVYISETPVGIDIESDNPRILMGTDYFVNDNESQFLGDLKSLHLIWGAKEAFYKWKEGQISDLKNEVTILKIEQNKQIHICYRNTIHLFECIQEEGVTVVLN